MFCQNLKSKAPSVLSVPFVPIQVADKGRAIRYNISSALPLHDGGMMTGAFLSCTLDPNLLLE